jgi:DNA-binding GntR family transcriptional regulator
VTDPLPVPPVPGGGLSRVTPPDRLVERVETVLRDAIMSGQLAPGSHLSVPEIARQLGVSRTPAREALLALHRLGLVEVRPRRGAVVVAGGQEDLRQLFELREALEGMAARLAAGQMPDPDVAALQATVERHRAAVEAADLEAHVQTDLEFHAMIAAGSANPRLAGAIGQLDDQISVLLRLNSGRPGGMDEGVLRAHGRVARSIERRDADQAEQRMREHIKAVHVFMSGQWPSPPGSRPTSPARFYKAHRT